MVEALYRGFAGAGHEAEIWCTDLASFEGPRHEAGAATVNGMSVRRFRTKCCRLYLFDPHHLVWRGLGRALREETGPETLFHVNSFPSYQALAALKAVKAGAPVVITPHHDIESLGRYLRLWRARRVMRGLLSAARAFPRLNLAVHTRATKRFWVEEIGWPEEQIRIIPNGVYPDEFDKISAEETGAAAAGWPRGEVRVLFVGRLARAKGVDILLRALARTRGASLLIIGPDAGEGENLRKLAQELKIEERVNFLAPPPRRQVCAAFRACDLFVLPSRFGENFGIAAIEAMAARKPVIVSDSGGLPSLVRAEENGLIFSSESVEGLTEALNYLAGAASPRQSYGEAGRRMMESAYTWERVVKEYLALFTAALSAGKSRAGS